ncbi:MAG: DNA-directed RNA polymerase subunit omega [Acholeplasmataceae bacterium]
MSNKDGLRYPSIDALLEKIPSKYKLVYAASKVARVLEEANLEVEDASSEKSIGVALEEIIAGRVDIEFK